MAAMFEIHVEDFNHALHISKNGHTSKDALWWLMYKCQEYEIRPTFYILEDFDKEFPEFKKVLEAAHYEVKSHGVHHYYDEKADRSPYFNQEGQPGACGGFYFRFLPLWIIKKEIARTGLFYIHPHDLDETHPRLSNPLLHWKRHVGLKSAKAKLEKLLQEVTFE
jgi:hypothetical protein